MFKIKAQAFPNGRLFSVMAVAVAGNKQKQ
jgi:hypothetical protein